MKKMDKFIPVNKKSKKARKEYYAKKRNTWGELNPMTRTMPNGKGYNRKKLKQEDRRNGSFSQNNRETAVFDCEDFCTSILAADDTMLIYSYCCYNVNNDDWKKMKKMEDGEILIHRTALVEP